VHILVDTPGLVLAVVVTNAALDDAAAALEVFEHVNYLNCLRTVKSRADNKSHNRNLIAGWQSIVAGGTWRSSPGPKGAPGSPVWRSSGLRSGHVRLMNHPIFPRNPSG